LGQAGPLLQWQNAQLSQIERFRSFHGKKVSSIHEVFL
jgi:hypothetical protein